jgi:ABC-2 type transport system permease protein
MNGMRAMLKKEALEIRYTSRKWVIPAIVVFCAVASPVLTYYLPTIAKGEGVDATALGACSVFLSFLSSLVVLSIVSVTSGIVSSEVRSGTAVLVVTKPVSRRAFVLSKIISQSAIVIVATLVGTAIFALITSAVFGNLPVAHLLSGVGVWLSLALLYTVLMVALSSRIDSQSAVAGLGVGFYIVLTIGAGWGPLKAGSPAGIERAAQNLASGGGGAWLWPTLVTLALAAVLAALSGRIFAHREI